MDSVLRFFYRKGHIWSSRAVEFCDLIKRFGEMAPSCWCDECLTAKSYPLICNGQHIWKEFKAIQDCFGLKKNRYKLGAIRLIYGAIISNTTLVLKN